MCNVSATSLLRFILVSDTNAVSLRNRNNLLNRIFIIRRQLTLSYSNAKFNYASSVYHYLLIITKISTACKLYKLCLYCTKLRRIWFAGKYVYQITLATWVQAQPAFLYTQKIHASFFLPVCHIS